MAKPANEIKITADATQVTLNGTVFDVTAEGDVTAFTNKAVETTPVKADAKKNTATGFTATGAQANGATITATAEGFAVATAGALTVKQVPKKEPSALDALVGTEKDGWIYAGQTEEGTPLFAAKQDEAGLLTFTEAQAAAEKLQAQGIKARVPTGEELSQLFNNKAKIGGFNETGSLTAGEYVTSTTFNTFKNDDKFVESQNFLTGRKAESFKTSKFAVRLVR